MKNIEETGGYERETGFTRVFIEFGTGKLPVPFIGTREFRKDELYIGIERNAYDLQVAQENAEKEARERGITHINRIFINADAERLPLKDGSAEEIFLGNLTGAYSHHDEREKFIKEAQRIVKKDGLIIVKETFTPAPLAELRDSAARYGLVIEKVVAMDSPEWDEVHHRYAWDERKWVSPSSYIVFMRKVSAS